MAGVSLTPKDRRMMPLPVKSPTVPLCVDLDGTLLKTDLLFESLAHLLRQKPWMVLLVPFWLLQGRAALKRNLAYHVSMSPALLPYNQPFLEWLRAERSGGRELYLATAADAKLAGAVAEYLGIFTKVLASDGHVNLKGKRKLEALRQTIPGEFEYAGDSSADLSVFEGSSAAVLVNASPAIAARVRKMVPVTKTFEPEKRSWKTYVRALRAHQWIKNVLIYIPLITSHRLMHGTLLLDATVGVILFSLCCSAQYILNDIADLDSDRSHPTKRRRPFASGAFSIRAGLLGSLVLLAVSLGTALAISRVLFVLLSVYFILSLSYSLYLKRVLLLDVFVLSGLYTYRIIVGLLVTHVEFSEWLISFALFLFLSMAFSKRATELRSAARSTAISGRDYEPEDLAQVNIFGVCSAFLSAVVFILYLQSDRVRELYKQPQLLWLLSPVYLYWISRIWMLTSRGKVHEDPVLFVLKDRTTYLVCLVAGAIMLAATSSWGISLR
jgi:4-hydroxybenzoate polyprenyltransferase